MKSPHLYYIAALLLLSFFAWDSYHKRQSLERSLKVIEQNLQKQRKENVVKFDSIQRLIVGQDKEIDGINSEIKDLDSRKADINQKAQDEKDRITTFSADSLERYFTRRYR